MNTLQKGFTLIELMIVVAIIGILAAVAIPSYQDYTGRAQVAEAVSLTSALKVGLAEAFADSGEWPASVDAIGGTKTGKYVALITIASGAGLPGVPVIVTATMKTTGVNRELQNAQTNTYAMASPDGTVWTCGEGPDVTSSSGSPSVTATSKATNTIAAKFLPSACKE